MTGKMGAGVLATGVLLVGALALVVLSGCGGERGTGLGQPTHGESQAGEDVLLFGGEDSPDKSLADGELKAPPHDLTAKELPVDGNWKSFEVGEGAYRKHGFMTLVGRVYQVQVSVRWGHTRDDPDLAIGRNPYIDWGHCWETSQYPDPYPDAFVFRSTKNKKMYVLVRGYADGGTDGQISYSIRIRRAQFATWSH